MNSSVGALILDDYPFGVSHPLEVGSHILVGDDCFATDLFNAARRHKLCYNWNRMFEVDTFYLLFPPNNFKLLKHEIHTIPLLSSEFVVQIVRPCTMCWVVLLHRSFRRSYRVKNNSSVRNIKDNFVIIVK